jgi:uncharacterized cofD-like protein
MFPPEAWSGAIPRERSVHASAANPCPVRRPRIVALGGGTGLPILLRGLKAAVFPPGSDRVHERDQESITAIVTVADDGGSSGRLRREYGLPAPGDLRNCLLALSDGDPGMAAMFAFRFPGTGDVAGHSLGNLILTALCHAEEDGFVAAVKHGAELLGARGRVFPATAEPVTLLAQLSDGSAVEGESRISSDARRIRRLMLRPERPAILGEVADAIHRADVIAIGPGSLYTSVIAILLVPDLARQLARARARVVLVMNLMTQPGETDGYTAVDHLLAIRRHAPGVRIDDILLHTAPLAPAGGRAMRVAPDADLLRAMGCRVMERDLAASGPTIHHDPAKLGNAVLELAGTEALADAGA